MQSDIRSASKFPAGGKDGGRGGGTGMIQLFRRHSFLFNRLSFDCIILIAFQNLPFSLKVWICNLLFRILSRYVQPTGNGHSEELRAFHVQANAGLPVLLSPLESAAGFFLVCAWRKFYTNSERGNKLLILKRTRTHISFSLSNTRYFYHINAPSEVPSAVLIIAMNNIDLFI